MLWFQTRKFSSFHFKNLLLAHFDLILTSLWNELKPFEYNKLCLKQPLSKRPKIGFQNQLSLNTGQKYYRMLQREHSAILWTVIKTFVLSILSGRLRQVLQLSFEIAAGTQSMTMAVRLFRFLLG